MSRLNSALKRWHLFALALVAVALVAGVPGLAHALGAGSAVAGLAGLAGTTTLISDADAALKIIADGSLIRNIVTDSELMDLFTQDTNVQTDRTTGGRYIERAQQFRLGGGYGYRKDNEYIPVPGVGQIKNSKIYLRKSIGVVEMSGDTMRRVKGDEGAYLNWAEEELPNLVERMVNADDRVMIGFGAGAKARVASISGLVITLKDGHGIAGYTNAWLNFLEGDTIVFSSTITATALRGSAGAYAATVTAIDQANNTITVDAVPASTVANDYLFDGDNSGQSTVDSTGDNRESMGLLGLVDDGTILTTLQGLPRTTSVQWKSVVIDGSAAYGDTGSDGQLNEDVIQYAYDETGVRGGGKPNVIVAALSGQRSFWKALRHQRQLLDPAKADGYVGGKKGVSMLVGDRKLEVRAARKMPAQLCFLLQTDTFTRHMLNEFEWDQTTGAIWRQVTDSTGRKDAFYAYGCKYQENSVKQPRKSCVIRGLTPTS